MINNSPDILIASSSLDRLSWQPVAEKLTGCGYDVTVYEADRVAMGETSLKIQIDDNGLEIYYDGNSLNLQNVSAAWRRRPNMFVPDQENWVRQFQMDEERKHMQSILWSNIPEPAWLNAPAKARNAEDKMSQLLIAHDLGFTTPKTIVTNDWESINNDLPENVILKMHFGVMYDKDHIQALYTTKFKNSTHTLPTADNPFPGFWQPYIKKRKEWRITVVGDDTFDAAIYTTGDAMIDWRKPEAASTVTYCQENFPDTERDKCIKFLGRLGLKYGAFDFIEDHDGRITFLECNSNGQFRWLEDRLGLPISSAIADQLIKISQGSEQ